MIQIPLTSATDGMTGIPLPYLLHSDPMVTCIMFLCMLLVSVVFAHGKKHFLQGLKNFVRGRERGSMFDEVTASDLRHTIVLVFHTCLMLAFGVYRYLAQSAPALFEQYSHLGILAGLTAIFILFLLFKWAAYSLVNSLFFQKVRNELWITSFVNLFIWLGIVLLPLLLVIVYFEISSHIATFLLAFPLVLGKICLFCKCFSNFFEKIYGAFHFILYFCALEIFPDLILWKGMELISNNLIFKF